ncbi:MAG: phage portal protein [Pseudorhodoferax sp.]
MSRRKAKRMLREKALNALPVGTGGGWLTVSSTAWDPSAWQTDDHRPVDTALSNVAVFSCVTLIAADIGKLRPRLVERKDGIWQETYSAAFSPVLRKPNHFQNHIQFKESWITSKLVRGNTYALKERDERGVVKALYPLNPDRVTPLVTPLGDIYYQLAEDPLAGLDAAMAVVPASEIIHDRMNCLFHPLVGLSPLYAAAATAKQGLEILKNSSAFFGNSSRPGGILIAPGPISQANAQLLKDHWNTNYSGANAGRIAVLGDNMKFESMRMTAVDSQLIEQANISAQTICAAYHCPPFMVGLGAEPTYSNGETRTSHYYSQCLQSLIEHMEEALDDGLGLLGSPKDGRTLGVELDLAGLMRMDTKSHYEALTVAIKGGLMAPNEGRSQINLPAVAGGDTIFMQEQNYSLEALSNRPPPDAEAAPVEPARPVIEDDGAKTFARALIRKFQEAGHVA